MDGTVMTTILRIDSSIRTDRSVSRVLTGKFVAAWKQIHPHDSVVERDLATNPAPHVTEQVMGAMFTPPGKRSQTQSQDAALADELIEELLAADVLVIGAPMYNLSVSSSLKAWIDHVARAGVTFKYTDKGPVGLITVRKAYVFTARGGIYSSGPGKLMDFHETYLRSVLGFLGITDVTFVHTEGLAMGEEAADQAIANSHSAIVRLLAA